MSKAIPQVSVQDAFEAVTKDKSAVMIDVREMDEIAAVSTLVAKAIPMSSMDPTTFESQHQIPKDQNLYILCRSGGRSQRVALALAERGFKNLHNVAGGIIAWESEGLPVKRGK